MCREQAVNLLAPGSLPDMRSLLEGEDWDTGRLDLSVPKSAERYSMQMSVTGLILTDDDYFILQRRSNAVGHGLGSLAGSVNGGAHHGKDGTWMRRLAIKLNVTGLQRWNLRCSALRETREEIGLRDKTFAKLAEARNGVPPFDRPFIGAGYNLRYGRDLNFYCCFRTTLKAGEIASQRRYAKDKWEVENLVFLHRSRVSVDAIKSGDLSRELSKPARHLTGALYAWAVYNEQPKEA
jgi:hypothetical protein